jgi:hypothetical protein
VAGSTPVVNASCQPIELNNLLPGQGLGVSITHVGTPDPIAVEFILEGEDRSERGVAGRYGAPFQPLDH